MKIGNIKLDNQVILAPLAGISDKVFRMLNKRFGVSLVCSEMISAKGLLYTSKKTFLLLDYDPCEHPISVQIFGREPSEMAVVAQIIAETGIDIIDINLGCSVRKIVKAGQGCALMREPALVGKIVEKIAGSVKIPVTVKIRKGWNSEEVNAVEIAQIVQESGASAITVHGRLATQGFSGVSDLEIIRQVKEKVSVPVIGNGDIRCPADALKMIEQTSCDGVMIGRGTLGNPWLTRNIVKYLQGEEIPPSPSLEERLATALWHVEQLIALKGERTGISEGRKHLAWYTKGLPCSSMLRGKFFVCETYEQVSEILEDYKKRLFFDESENFSG